MERWSWLTSPQRSHPSVKNIYSMFWSDRVFQYISATQSNAFTKQPTLYKGGWGSFRVFPGSVGSPPRVSYVPSALRFGLRPFFRTLAYVPPGRLHGTCICRRHGSFVATRHECQSVAALASSTDLPKHRHYTLTYPRQY